MFSNRNFTPRLLLALLLIASLGLLAACTAGGDTGPGATNNEMNHEDEGEHEDDHEHDEDEQANTVPNNGAVITIVAPESGSSFVSGEDVVVEIATENFTLGEDGNHWHVYVDGESWGMVMGGNTSQVLRGLDPGEHEVEVFMSNADHQDLEEGDTITISVVEE